MTTEIDVVGLSGEVQTVPLWPDGRPSRILWPDGKPVFKIEHEEFGLDDSNIDVWLEMLHKNLQSWPRPCSCCILNLSRNSLGDYSVHKILKAFIQEQVPIQVIRLQKNLISDDGVRAMADFILHSADPPVSEIHLSHNKITSEGAMTMFRAVRQSNRYPSERGRNGSPLWLRLENNCIEWTPVLHEVKRWNDFTWASRDRRDAWLRKGCSAVPQLAMHRSYVEQSLSSIDQAQPCQNPSDSARLFRGWFDDVPGCLRRTRDSL